MNKIELMHLDAITRAEYDPEDKHPNYVGFAEECSKLTKELAIEFVTWLWREIPEEAMAQESWEHWWNEWLKTKQ